MGVKDGKRVSERDTNKGASGKREMSGEADVERAAPAAAIMSAS